MYPGRENEDLRGGGGSAQKGYGELEIGDRIPAVEEILFTTDEFNRKYNEHMRVKEKIRAEIEKITREKNFLEGLRPGDYAYMYAKTRESAL